MGRGDDDPMAMILITGGVRSGKSRWAEQLASRYGKNVWYVATAQVNLPEGGDPDPEMVHRIALHRARRPARWRTLEAPDNVQAVLEQELRNSPRPDAVLLDCLTLLVSNWLLAGGNSAGQADLLLRRADKLASWLATRSFPVIVVTNEVGSGIVPAQPLARMFRDVAGLINQTFASYSEKVYLVCAGIPVELRTLDARKEGT